MLSLKSKSLIRKLSIIFAGAALVPFIILYYLYTQFDGSEKLDRLFSIKFSIILIIVGTLLLFGFLFIRMTFKKIVLLKNAVQKSSTSSISAEDERMIRKLAEEEEGEIADLAKSFLNIVQQGMPKSNEPKKEAVKITEPDKPQSKAKISNVVPLVNYDNLLQEIIESLIDAVGARYGALFAYEIGEYKLKAWMSRDNITREQLLSSAKLYFDKIGKEKMLFLPQESETNSNPVKIFSPPLACSPLIYANNFLGMIMLSGNIYWKHMDNFSNEHMSVILNVSRQLAASFTCAWIENNFDRTIFEAMVALAQAVEARDPYSRDHAARVSRYAQKIGELMGLKETDIEALRDASLLHDIGKKGIKYGILFKSGRLEQDELQLIRNHPVVSEMLVSPLKSYEHLRKPIRHHHELLDGGGYPDGLKGEDITIITKILAVANLYDILLMQRPYRLRMNHAAAKKEMGNLAKAGKIDKEILQHLYSAINILRKENPQEYDPANQTLSRKEAFLGLLNWKQNR